MNARDAVEKVAEIDPTIRSMYNDNAIRRFREALGWDGSGEPPAVVILGDGTLKRLEAVTAYPLETPSFFGAKPIPMKDPGLFRLVDPEDPQ